MASAVKVAQTEKVKRFEARCILTWVGLMLITLAVITYVGISAYVAEKLSHPTRKALSSTPAQYGLKYEDVQFNSTGDNIPLKGWFIDSPGTKAIVMMHGRNGVRDDKGIDMMDIAKAFAQHNYDVLTFDFRAHGQSGGDRYSLGQWEVRDVAGALNYLKGRGVTRIGTIAYSMGAATELLTAPDHPEMQAVIADSVFADLPALLDKELPKSSGLPVFFNPGVVLSEQLLFGIDLNNTKPERAMSRLGNRPVLLIHSATDDLIPVSHAYALQKAGARDPNLQLWIAPGKGHVQAFKNNRDEYLRRVIGFFDANLK